MELNSYKKSIKALITLIILSLTGISTIKAQEIDLEMPFSLMGIESLQAVHIIDQLGKEFNRELTAALMFDYPNIKTLADYIDGNIESEVHLHKKQNSPKGINFRGV